MKTEIIDYFKTLGAAETAASMSAYTTFKTGGPAELLIQTGDRYSIESVLKESRIQGIPLTVIGGGSNLLVSDRGIPGIVLRIAGSSSQPEFFNDKGLIYCEAAYPKNEFMNWCASGGFGGVEFMAGIPGCVGGGIYMNAGTYLGWFADILESIEIASPEGGIKLIDIPSAGAGYRSTGLPAGSVITGGYFKLKGSSDPVEIRSTISALIEERNQKHPVKFPSAGSVFKNPEGHSSWKLIRDCGLTGRKIGGAEVSSLHTNFIINSGGATSADIFNLINEVKAEVLKASGFSLETEIKMIGDFE